MPGGQLVQFKHDQRAEICFLHKDGMTQKEILDSLRCVHGHAAVSQSTVSHWVSRL